MLLQVTGRKAFRKTGEVIEEDWAQIWDLCEEQFWTASATQDTKKTWMIVSDAAEEALSKEEN